MRADFLAAGFLSAVFFSDLGLAVGNGNSAGLAGVSTLYGTGVDSTGLEPKIFFKNDSILNLLVLYLCRVIGQATIVQVPKKTQSIGGPAAIVVLI